MLWRATLLQHPAAHMYREFKDLQLLQVCHKSDQIGAYKGVPTRGVPTLTDIPLKQRLSPVASQVLVFNMHVLTCRSAQCCLLEEYTTQCLHLNAN